VFVPDGTPLERFSATGLDGPRGIALSDTADDTVWVTSGGGDTGIYEFDTQGATTFNSAGGGTLSVFTLLVHVLIKAIALSGLTVRIRCQINLFYECLASACDLAAFWLKKPWNNSVATLLVIHIVGIDRKEQFS